jgi:hypothetical protein
MTEVELPDGTIVEFPDGTPPDVMKQALQRRFGTSVGAPTDAMSAGLGRLSKLTQDAAGGPNQDDMVRANMEASRDPGKEKFDNLPEWQKPIVAASDIFEIGMDGLTFGLGNRVAAGIRAPFTAKDYAEELASMRAQTDAARKRAGSAGVAADIGGSMVVPMAAARRGATLLGRAGTATMTGAKGVGARAALAAAEGAGYGAAQAAGRGEDIGEGATFGAVGGGLGSVAGDAISAGVGKASSVINKMTGKTTKIPELPQLRAAAKAAYDKADEAGVIIRPEPIQRLNAQIQDDLAEFGFDPALQPRIKPVLDRLQAAGEGNITLKGIDTIRKVANNARISQDPSERKLGWMLISRIDDFVDSVKPADVLTGDPRKGAFALSEARSLWRRIAKNEELMTAVKKAELRAGSTGSGGNTENAIRQNLRRIVEKGKGWTTNEMNALEEIVMGTPTQNVMRLAGKLSPSGNGLMAALGVGGAMVNPLLGAASLGGMGAKAIADRGVMKGVEALDELIRAGGTKEALESFKGAIKSLSQSQREAIVRAAFGTPGAVARQPSQQ